MSKFDKTAVLVRLLKKQQADYIITETSRPGKPTGQPDLLL